MVRSYVVYPVLRPGLPFPPLVLPGWRGPFPLFLLPALGPFQRVTSGNGHNPFGWASEWQIWHAERAVAIPQPSRLVG